jgi:hypothetical protein
MPSRPDQRSLVLALLLPIAAVGAMIVRAEITTRGGRPWVVHIEGYDPRDLVRGHYLRFGVKWRWESPFDSCTESTCCYCLNGAGPPPVEPDVTRISCSATSACASWIPEERAQNLNQFFIPEDKGTELEKAIRNKEAQISLRVSSGGNVVITDLLLDGKPWRDAAK